MKISTIIRCILSIGLVYLIYTETGMFTALGFLLIVGFTELQTYINDAQLDINESIINIGNKLQSLIDKEI